MSLAHKFFNYLILYIFVAYLYKYCAYILTMIVLQNCKSHQYFGMYYRNTITQRQPYL